MNAASKIRAVFKEATFPLTITDIRERCPDLKATEISMALCYLRRQKYLTRELVKSPLSYGRKEVWAYTYHAQRTVKPLEIL